MGGEGGSGCLIPGFQHRFVISAHSEWKGCEVLSFACHPKLSLVEEHGRVNTGMVSSGSLAGSVLDVLEIWEVTLVYLQKEHGTVLVGESLVSPKKCDWHVTVFVHSKYGPQLNAYQGLQSGVGRSPGSHKTDEKNRICAGPEEQVRSMLLQELVPGQRFLPCLSKHKVRGQRWDMAPFLKGWLWGQSDSEGHDSHWFVRDPERVPQ